MGVNPSYRSWYENDCFVSVAVGIYQESNWSSMEWFSVNVCSDYAEIMENEWREAAFRNKGEHIEQFVKERDLKIKT